MEVAAVVVVVAYVTLVVEMTVFSIPSEASTYQLFFRAAASDRGDVALDRARRQRAGHKLLVFFLPTAIGVLLFLVPLVAAFWPPLIDRLLPILQLRQPGALYPGLALVVLGRVVTFASVLQLRRHQASQTLQPRGLFRRSRNPGLVGMFVLYLGLCFVFPCIVLFVGFVPYVWNMHRKVLMEESHLSRTAGPDYQQYLREVPRYFLFR